MLHILLRALQFGFFVYMAGIAAIMLLIGGVFTIKLLVAERSSASFDAPGGGWTLVMKENCFSGSCLKLPRLRVARGPMAGFELICRAKQDDTSRVVFDRIIKTTWRDNDTMFAWEAGDPPSRGQIDIIADCSESAIFDDRPSLISLRFHENCIIAGCGRRIDWIEAHGGEVFTTPCRSSATGDVPVFTRPDDPRGQIQVDLDAVAKTAAWTSRDTKQSGRVSFATDCDVARQTRKRQPA